MMPDGITETVHVNFISDNNYHFLLRISASFEMNNIDFEPRLKVEAQRKAQSLCNNGIKNIKTNFEEITTLDYAPGGYNLKNNMYVDLECL